ncbi:1-aminocyclopropane-1-carboxylate deaminase/D-cysteine desulfhydrase [Saccharospirillum alexandrii]|uniref:1-aminocyclopropane-1-carboxylate deaminase/D-cysteine desulfhydrase n=1 Tax=Saccharospirillum alexandrii TaxID=2448477 RepID=UPI0013E040E3|nr:pyridoxal-phosphate dependent enzyme [Saccharospirillum alexandrii]
MTRISNQEAVTSTGVPRLPAEPGQLVIDRTPWAASPLVFTVRGDRLHPIISGNKWFKLRAWLVRAEQQGARHLVSVGGPYSNHLHALAYAGYVMGLATTGWVRGPEPVTWSATLLDCQRWGMKLHFIDREHYRQRETSEFAAWACHSLENALFIPEGGWSPQAIDGSGAWWRLAGTDLDALVCPVGSGTTLAGLVRTAPESTRVIGVPVYRDPDHYISLIEKLASVGVQPGSYTLWTDAAGKGFGRVTEKQTAFMADFEQREGIELDPVYTGKTFMALQQRLNDDPGLVEQRLGILHTGGLQGRRSKTGL